jgi:adenylosuccinate lyase
MLTLAEKVGKQSAHTLVYEMFMRAQESGQSLKQAILASADMRQHLAPEALESLFDYRRHIGLCREMTDRVIRLAQEERARENRA